MDKVVLRSVVARAVLDTRLQNLRVRVEVYELGRIRVVCYYIKDLPQVMTVLETYKKEKLFKDINLHAVTA